MKGSVVLCYLDQQNVIIKASHLEKRDWLVLAQGTVEKWRREWREKEGKGGEGRGGRGRKGEVIRRIVVRPKFIQKSPD